MHSFFVFVSFRVPCTSHPAQVTTRAIRKNTFCEMRTLAQELRSTECICQVSAQCIQCRLLQVQLLILMMMMICGPSGQVPQRNAIPPTVKLWQLVQSHAGLKPGCAWTQSDLCPTLTTRSHFVLYHNRSDAGYIIVVHALKRVRTGLRDTPFGLLSGRGRHPLLGTLGPSLSFRPILAKPPYLQPHCHSPITYCAIRAVQLGV